MNSKRTAKWMMPVVMLAAAFGAGCGARQDASPYSSKSDDEYETGDLLDHGPADTSANVKRMTAAPQEAQGANGEAKGPSAAAAPEQLTNR